MVSAKVPEEVYKEILLRVPEGDRSDFIREAIMEKLQKIPRPNKLFDLETRMQRLEEQLAELRKYLADLELLTYGNRKVKPQVFCGDELDRQLMEYLMHYKGATTPELAEFLKINRWLVLNRLQKMQKASEKQLGKAIVEYYGGEKSGKKKAWWINEDLVQEQ